MPQIVTRRTCSFLKIDEICGLKWADHRGGRGDTKNVQVDFPGQPENWSRLAVVAWLRGCVRSVKTTYPRDSQSPRQPPTRVLSSPPAKFIVSDGELACFGIPSIFYITYNRQIRFNE